MRLVIVLKWCDVMREHKNNIALSRGILLGLLLLGLGSVVSAANVTNARLWPAPDNTRLVFEVTAGVEHKLFSLSNPRRIVLDMSRVKLLTDLSDLSLAGSPINRIRSAARNQGDLRIVLDLARDVTPKSFLLKPNEQYGNRLVVDLYEREAATEEPKIVKSVDQQSQQRDIIVVIDAGHGGDDPGALGPGRVREKDVVLAISRELNTLINQKKGFQAKMTRSGDYYIGLRQRTAVARKHNADLFVSVHADAFDKPQASGASVYALSKRGATSEAARWLAKKENSADLIGGVGGVSLDDKDDILAEVLLDLSMTASLKASLGVGDHVLRSMGGMTHLHKKRVEQAGFVVLKSPDIPSILVETGFISNPAEAGRLKTRKYQKQIAHAIYRGVDSHFRQTPPPGTLLSYQQSSKLAALPRTYKVQKGDTLSAIALKNQITVSQLRKANHLQSDNVKIGQIIQIPAS